LKPPAIMIVPGEPGQRTGGYLYDAHLVAQLRWLGREVTVVGLDGCFPDGDHTAQAAMRDTLQRLPDGSIVIIDGLALGGVPGPVEEQAARLELVALVHHPLADETGLDAGRRRRLLALERRSLAACRRVVVTSVFTSHRLVDLGLVRSTPVVVEPGVKQAPLARTVSERLDGREPGPGAPMLCVASLTPRKGQDVLVEALAGLGDRDWSCVLAGSTARDPGFADRVRTLIERFGLADRVRVPGECDQQTLEAAYRRAAVSVLPSHYEGYGMVVSEALARGLPLITTTGGALTQTAPDDCCLKVPPGDVGALRAALARWLDDAALRQRLTAAAVDRRARLRRWSDVGREFDAALGSVAV
jgi:glycosyltransferase involved in cell wall biosynthesis